MESFQLFKTIIENEKIVEKERLEKERLEKERIERESNLKGMENSSLRINEKIVLKKFLTESNLLKQNYFLVKKTKFCV